jgi:hypothetical protein
MSEIPEVAVLSAHKPEITVEPVERMSRVEQQIALIFLQRSQKAQPWTCTVSTAV